MDLVEKENDLITPTLNVKRDEIDNKYGKEYLFWQEDQTEILGLIIGNLKIMQESNSTN